MSEYDVENAIHRLRDLGVDVSNLHRDYYKIPLENIDLKKNELEHPKKEKVSSKHYIIIDSRERDYSIYPYPNDYLIELMEPHRNVEKIELVAAMMPKTEYNVNSENNLLLVTISGVKEALYLTPGQYLLGTNVLGLSYTSNGAIPISGLIAEVARVLNTHSFSGNAFNVFLATTPASSNGTGVNASVLNRIFITNSSVNFSIDFVCSSYSSSSPFRLLGFFKQVYTSGLSNVFYGSDNLGTCSPSDLQSGTTRTVNIPSICSLFDYDLIDDPKYLIMNLEFGNKSAERIESSDIASNQKFAIILYDANEPDNIESFAGTDNSNVQITLARRPGRLKALKGSDFDKKIINFDPPITLENFKITFYKYDNTLYDFHNREHLLSFELDVADYDPRYRY
jgi:hypothetical protein